MVPPLGAEASTTPRSSGKGGNSFTTHQPSFAAPVPGAAKEPTTFALADVCVLTVATKIIHPVERRQLEQKDSRQSLSLVASIPTDV